MIEGIGKGEIAAVLVKDLSRVGRDYLQVGFYTEVMFREKGVRFVAITNGVDSDKRESSEFAPFLNIMNEWYKFCKLRNKRPLPWPTSERHKCQGRVPRPLRL